MKNHLIQKVEQQQMQEHTKVRTGDTVAAEFIVQEGTRNKSHTFKGIVIAQKRGGLGANITIRKISHGVGVEKVVQLHSPNLKSLTIIKPGKVRQSRIFYIRELTGRAMRIPERLKKRSNDNKSETKSKNSENTES